MTTELENLALFYRTMSTEQLTTYRASLHENLKAARRGRSRERHTVAFCTTRIDLITRVLAERGVSTSP